MIWDCLIKSIIDHTGNDWFAKCAEDARMQFAKKGMIGFHPNKDNTLFELCVHGEPPNETPAYMLRFACDHWAGVEPLIAVYVIAQEVAIVRRKSRRVIN